MAYYRSARRKQNTQKPLVAFLLVASFGILFAGCGGEPSEIPQADEFSFTMDDIAKVKEMASDGSGAFIPRLELSPDAEGEDLPPVIDVGSISKFNAIRKGTDGEQDLYRVTNTFLNVRNAPQVTAAQIGSFNQSDSVEVLEFVDAAWAKVVYENEEGYVASRYISKLVSEEQLEKERQKYNGLYFVDFGFLNVRKSADTDSEKIGELPGQSFVRPLTVDQVWARIPFGDGDGYVAVQYLTPFLPNFLVRQSTFDLPVVHFRLENPDLLNTMPQHIAALKEAGYDLWTMTDFYQLLLEQEERDVRLDSNVIILAISDVTPDNVDEVSGILRASAADATLFVASKYIGDGAISRQEVTTLLANGLDIQSAGHTGDDLRSLTNAQVELELSQSRQILEEVTGRTVYAIGYPMGGVNDRVTRKAAEVGYLLGLSAAPDTGFDRSQLLRMPSVTVHASDSPEDLLTELE